MAAFLPIDSLTLCQAINNLLGLGSYSAGDFYITPTTATYGHFIGSYSYANSIQQNGGTWPQGKMMGCLEEAYQGTYLSRPQTYMSPINASYFFFDVLLIR